MSVRKLGWRGKMDLADMHRDDYKREVERLASPPKQKPKWARKTVRILPDLTDRPLPVQ